MGVSLRSRGYNPMTGLGDLIYGGLGTITGATNAALTSLGARARARHSDGTLVGGFDFAANQWGAAIDGSDATGAIPNNGGKFVRDAGSRFEVDLGAAKRIGRYRIYQPNGGRQQGGWILQWSGDGVTWADADDQADYGAYTSDSGILELAAPITARYWGIAPRPPAPSFDIVEIRALELYAVTTVGAGNLERLAPGSEGEVLTIRNGIPVWE